MTSLPKYLLFKYLRFDKTQPFIALSALLAFLGVSIDCGFDTESGLKDVESLKRFLEKLH